MNRILVVDDKDENRYLLRMLFEGHGYQVDVARHGAEALVLARQNPPRLVVSDLLMPVMDGYTLLRHWKADAHLRQIPFVVYTATYTEPKDEQLALDLGADGFILKPAEPAPFMARIDAILAQVNRPQLTPARVPAHDEREVLREYNEVLVRKLEHKALELERNNRELQQDIARRQRAEADVLRYRDEAETSQTAQRLSAASYRMLFEHAPDGILIIDSEGICLGANPSACGMLGYPREQLLGMAVAQIVAPHEVARIAPALREVQAGAPHFQQWQMQRHDAIVFTAEAIATRMPDGTVLAILRDISARQRSETLLAGQRQVLELIASGAALGDTLATLVRLVEALVPEMLGSILVLDADGVHVRCGAAPSLPEAFNRAFDGEPIGPEAGSCGTAAYRREQVIVADIASDPLWQRYREVALGHGLRACWSTPIFDQQQCVLGTFAFYFRSPQRPTAAHLQLLDSVTHTAAIAIAKAREEATLRELSWRMSVAEETERKAIAAELHDRIGQNLAGLNLTLNLMRAQLSPQSLRKLGASLLDACALAAESIVQVRHVMAELRPPALDDYGLLAALRLYAERYAGRCGIAVAVSDGELLPRLPVNTELALFRIAQEALANVAKHAQARQITITVEQIDAVVRLQVHDDGVGFDAPTDAPAAGWGQMIMRERAQAIGATLQVQSAPGCGTRVIVDLERAP